MWQGSQTIPVSAGSFSALRFPPCLLPLPEPCKVVWYEAAWLLDLLLYCAPHLSIALWTWKNSKEPSLKINDRFCNTPLPSSNNAGTVLLETTMKREHFGDCYNQFLGTGIWVLLQQRQFVTNYWYLQEIIQCCEFCCNPLTGWSIPFNPTFTCSCLPEME